MPEINTTQMRDALAWATGDEVKAKEPSTNPFIWFWEAVEGDFNEDRSTAQILVDAGISMIPLVDQVCDLRDLVANCRKIGRDVSDTWAWLALVLTLIGLFPTIGSLVKGVLKLFFGFVRRSGGKQVTVAVELAMSWVIAFLRRRDVQKYLNSHKVDQVFKWLATGIRDVRGRVNVKALLDAFDKAIGVLEKLVHKVEYVPAVGNKAKKVLEEVRRIRLYADSRLAGAIKPVLDLIDTTILRLEREALMAENAIVDAANVHYRGALPVPAAASLMKLRGAPWLSKKGDKFYDPVDVADKRKLVNMHSAKLDARGDPRPEKDIFPPLQDYIISSFHTLERHTIHGPARLYRVLSPSSRAMSDCWVTKDVFDRLRKADKPKDTWRRFLAVWPDWNVNGQFVTYDIKAGEYLNTWRGIAASQTRKDLPGMHLEGGYEQIVFNIEQASSKHDTTLYYPILERRSKNPKLGTPLTQSEIDAAKSSMTDKERNAFMSRHLSIRQQINHPNISGPFETGWGYTEFEGSGMSGRIGLPSLPGQTTN